MCGIIAAFGKNPQKHVKNLYEQQKTRGRQGFGYIGIRNNKVVSYKRTEEEVPIMNMLNKEGKLDAIIFHHRLPTSTPNFETAAHPIKVSHESLDFDYYAVHNGVVSNPDELRKKHEELGFEYNTYIRTIIQTAGSIKSSEKFNDSEALAIELARLIDGDTDKIAAEGSMAFIVVQVNKETQEVQGVFYGRNYRNPLVMNRFGGTKNLTISSQNNKGFDVQTNIIYSLNLQTKFFSEFKKVELSPVYNSVGYGQSDFYKTHQYDVKTQKWVKKEEAPQLPPPPPNQPKMLQGYDEEEEDETIVLTEEQEERFAELAMEISVLQKKQRELMKEHDFDGAQDIQEEINALEEEGQYLLQEAYYDSEEDEEYDPKKDF